VKFWENNACKVYRPFHQSCCEPLQHLFLVEHIVQHEKLYSANSRVGVSDQRLSAEKFHCNHLERNACLDLTNPSNLLQIFWKKSLIRMGFLKSFKVIILLQVLSVFGQVDIKQNYDGYEVINEDPEKGTKEIYTSMHQVESFYLWLSIDFLLFSTTLVIETH